MYYTLKNNYKNNILKVALCKNSKEFLKPCLFFEEIYKHDIMHKYFVFVNALVPRYYVYVSFHIHMTW